MISYDFEYYKPAVIEEAVRLHRTLREQNKRPVYYTGGTEVTTLGRVNRLQTGAVIDLKGIPELHALQLQDDQLVMGAALPFSRLKESGLFPLLSQAVGGVADHTARSNITLGGNVCGQIIYRESALPLLLTDSDVVIAGEAGTRRLPFREVFPGQLQLQEGEFAVQFLTGHSWLQLPGLCLKKRKQGAVGYPVVTAAALRKDEQVRAAFSGLCAYPFRDSEMENILNRRDLPAAERIDQALQHIPAPVLQDAQASAEYRLFVLKNSLSDLLAALEG